MSKLTANQLTSRANAQSKLYGVKHSELKKNPVATYRRMGLIPSGYDDANDNNRTSYRTKTAIKLAREALNNKYLYDTEEVYSNVNIPYKVVYKDSKKQNRIAKEIQNTIVGRRIDMYNLIGNFIHEAEIIIIDNPDSPVLITEMGEPIISPAVPLMRKEGGNLIYRKMKEGQAYDLGVNYITKNNKWNTENGTCVFDYLFYKYADGRGIKKLLPSKNKELAYKNLSEIFGDNSLEKGVNIKQIELFCKSYDISMLALDKNESLIVYNKSEKQNLPTLVFVISNNHFYPIEDAKKIKSIVEKNKDKSSKVYYKITDDEEKKDIRKFKEVIYPVGNEPTGNNYATYIFSKLKTLPMGSKNLRVDNGNIKSFIINDVLYLTETPNKDFVEFITNTKGFYNGENPHNILGDLTTKYFDKLESKLSPIVFDTLYTKGIKDRNHYGATRNLECYLSYIHTQFGSIEEAVKSGHMVITDINKCYSNCIYNPLDDFIVYSIEDVWEEYSGVLKTGLYYVETDDLSLLTKTNIYSNKIIEKAIEEGIYVNIKKQLIHKKTHIDEVVIGKDYFRGLFDDIKELCGENTKVIKLLNNMIVGMLGRTETKKYKASVDTNADDIWEYFMNSGVDINDDGLLLKQVSDDLHLYGIIKKIKKLEITLPIWIQILDWSNIALYEMGKAVGGEIVFRHTDLIVSIGGKIPVDKVSDKWGDYKVETDISSKKLLSIMRENRGIVIHKFHHSSWKDNTKFNSSNQFEDIIKYATDNDGLLITGRAGTGKSYIVIEGLKGRNDVWYMSFTNKASRNIGGQTIHRSLLLKKGNKLTKDSYTNLKFKKYIVVDEIGMCPSYLLKHLHTIKKQYPQIIFICMGDVRQLKPVEEKRIKSYNVFSSPFVKEICGNNRIELLERHRYDLKLGEYLDNGYDNHDWSGLKFEKQSVKDLILSKNICYFNKTRHRINSLCNSYLSIGKESLKIGDEKVMILYNGLKVIAIASNKEYDFFNSEEYVVDCYNETSVILSSVYNHNLLQLNFEEFLKNFDMNYIGTTHKSQGDTYSGKVCLFDYNKLITDKHIIYTACSRATAFENVVIAEI
jgi:hypothetical protein